MSEEYEARRIERRVDTRSKSWSAETLEVINRILSEAHSRLLDAERVLTQLEGIDREYDEGRRKEASVMIRFAEQLKDAGP